MKRLVICILFCLSAASAWAQTNLKEKKFINEVINGKDQTEAAAAKEYLGVNIADSAGKPRFSRLYTDSVGRYVINNLRSAMKSYIRNVFYHFRDDSVMHVDSLGKRTIISKSALHKLSSLGRWRVEGILADSIVLTDKERADINLKIDQMRYHVWEKDLLNNADLITADSLNKIFGNTRGGIHNGWDTLRKKGYDKSYSFSVPIYFRDGNYCLFYYGYGCGSLCGYGEVAIYKKVNGKWQHWSKLTSWIS